MSSTKDFLDYVLDQIKNQDFVKSRKMFGEYAIYYDNKVVGLICDNQLFIKNTKSGKDFVEKEFGKENINLASPFPKAKDWILLEDEIENREFLNELIEITRDSLEEGEKKISKKK
ncbi:MAG: TfoX/Sxy family protein [Candidatus Pacebacteria bacterium]|nr:TfoX/Sxy family protein [Candidatus Paceibacterota bacterium]